MRSIKISPDQVLYRLQRGDPLKEHRNYNQVRFDGDHLPVPDRVIDSLLEERKVVRYPDGSIKLSSLQ